MCRYELSVNMKYGVFNMNLSDDYKTAINTYNKVKNEYEGIPCEIVVKDNGKPIFTKVNKDNSFDESIYYNCIISSLINLIIVVYDKYYLLSALIWLVFKDLSYSNGLSFVSH